MGYVRLARAQVLLCEGEREAALRELDAAVTALDGTDIEARIRVWGAVLRTLIVLRDGDAAQARRVVEGLAPRHVEGGADPDLAALVRIAAAVAIALGDAARAAHLLGVSAALLGMDDGRGYDTALRTPECAREALGDKAFQEAYDRGAALDRDAAIALLLRTGR
jgi:hypothetical protein